MPPIEPNQIVFLVLAGISVLLGLGVVVLNNPVRSALCLVVNFFVLALLYFGLKAQLLGITQIMVYAGAIMVLFLFVIMLLNLGGHVSKKEKLDVKPAIGGVLGVAMFGLLVPQIAMPFANVTTPAAHDGFGTPQAIGKSLWTLYAWPLEITSILLVLGIVGAVLLAKRRI